MGNFIQGIVAVFRGGKLEVVGLLQFKLLWGFVLGFFVASILISFLMTNFSKNMLVAMLETDIAMGYQKMYVPTADGTYEISFGEFEKQMHKLRLVYLLSFLVFVFFIALSMWRF